MYHVGYYDENGDWHRSKATFETYDDAQAYCDGENCCDPLVHLEVEEYENN